MPKAVNTQRVAEYKWRDGAQTGAVTAEDAFHVMDDITQRDGECTPEALLEAARSNNSPIHRAFEWDDSEAGHRWRLHQARNMIGAVLVTYLDNGPPKEPIRAIVSYRPHTGARQYIPVSLVMTDVEKRQRFLEEAYRELQNWRRRFANYHELSEVYRAIDRIKLD